MSGSTLLGGYVSGYFPASCRCHDGSDASALTPGTKSAQAQVTDLEALGLPVARAHRRKRGSVFYSRALRSSEFDSRHPALLATPWQANIHIAYLCFKSAAAAYSVPMKHG